MFCSKCGAPLNEGSKFCERCGALVNENNNNTNNNFNNTDSVNNMNNVNSVNSSNNLGNMNGVGVTNSNQQDLNVNSVNKNPGNKNKNIFIAIGGIVAVVVIVFVFIFVLGGNKKLICTGEESGMNVTYEFGFKSKKLANFKAKLVVPVSSSQMDAVIDSFDAMMDDYKKDGMDLKYEKGSDNLTVILSGSMKEVGAAMGLTESDLKATYDELKKEIQETEGYTCK